MSAWSNYAAERLGNQIGGREAFDGRVGLSHRSPVRRLGTYLVVWTALAGCGATEGTANSKGSLNGVAFSAVDSVYASGISPPIYLATYTGVDQLVGRVTGLLVSSDSHACGDISNPMTPGSTGFFAILFTDDGHGTVTSPTGPGTYYVSDPTSPFGQGQVAVVSEKPCGGGVANVGTVTLTSVSPNLGGTFDITFQDGLEVSGSLNAVSCGAASCD